MSLDPKLKDSVAYLQDHAHGLRAVLDMADAVTDIMALENAASEAERRRDTALNGLDETISARKAEIADLEGKIGGLKADAAAIIADATATAEQRASDMIAAATVEADNAHQQRKAQFEGQLSDLTAKFESATTALGSLNAEIEEATGKRDAMLVAADDLETRATKAKAYLAKLTEG